MMDGWMDDMNRPPHINRRQFSHQAFGVQITIRRQADGSRDSSGAWTPGAVSDIPIYAATEPMSLERDPLEGGVRLSERRIFYIADADVLPLRSSATVQTGADRILYNGVEYQVESVKEWDGFAEALCDRVEGQR